MPSQFRAHPAPPRRKRAAQPLADLVGPCMGPALARQGFGEADVLMHWTEIVGEHLADHCRPVKLQWRPRALDASAVAGEAATLVVRVEGAFAIVLQHMAAVVIERVNVYFGWRCVGKLVLKQGPLPFVRPTTPTTSAPDPAALERAEAVAGGIGDDRLRGALVGLGARVLRRRSPTEALPRAALAPPFG